MNIGLVAGEASGDLLGAALIEALRARVPQAHFVGLAGERMVAAGCEPLGSSEELAVMGLVEPLRHLPRLLRLRSRLRREMLARRIDLFVGIDAPAFNLGLARRLRERGIPTAQYVSPQVWAWRRGRVRSIARAVDAVLCLLPFEPAAYAGQPVRAEFVGHPLADSIEPVSHRWAAREQLGIAADATVVALLPGSRTGEVERLGGIFARTAVELQRMHRQPLHLLAPMAAAHLALRFAAQLAAAGAGVRLLDRQADTALAAADVALVASGTATLQALLHGTPMVVAYRLAPLTAFIARDLGLVKLQYFSLPNLLAGAALVPEFFQQAARPTVLATALHTALNDEPRRAELRQRFREIHRTLRHGGAARAAQVLLEVAAARGEHPGVQDA
ncbi:MAG: lipid-A-disaccharide synthase [Steroidobacteraceae bacterium]